MPKAKLTDALVARTRLPEGVNDYVLWDTEVTGFGLRVRPGGKSYILAYRPAGAGRAANTKRMKIATPETIGSATEARNLARVALGRIAAGADPLTERRQARAKERARLSDLLDRYDADLKRRNYVNRETVITGLKKRMAGLMARDVREITGAELAKIMEDLEKAGRAGAAQDFRSRSRAFFAWAATKAKVIDVNPLAGMRKERATRADRIAKAERGRALDDAELTAVWHAADPTTTVGRLVRYLILTGCRRNEAANLTRAMVDRKAAVIRLPATHTKQGRGHAVPIAPLLGDVLDACIIDARSDLVFASPRTGGPIAGWTQVVAKIIETSKVPFTLHDLRRTFRTGLSRLGVDVETAELALGHARSDLEAIYNRDMATGALAKAFGAWAEHVGKLTAPKQDVFL